MQVMQNLPEAVVGSPMRRPGRSRGSDGLPARRTETKLGLRVLVRLGQTRETHDISGLSRARPRGFEPLTFGSVARSQSSSGCVPERRSAC